MRTLKLTIAYDGTRYAGWQVQARRSQRSEARGQKPTIQGTLERVLGTILREPVRVIGSGRTDAGVHAEAQVAHVRTSGSVTRDRLLRSANALLPPDIAVNQADEAPPDFHARFNARLKRYRYRIFTGSVVPPFIRPYVHHVRIPLNVAAMRKEVAALRGLHDFRPFSRARSSRALRRGTIRAITAASLKRRGDELHLDIEGNGFLHTMVRSITGTLIDVGRGRLPAGTVRRMLMRGERALAGTTAPSLGLTLMSVDYRQGAMIPPPVCRPEADRRGVQRQRAASGSPKQVGG